MSDLFDKNKLAAVEILESWGINPYDVVAANMTTEGYLRFRRTPLGNIQQGVDGEAYVDFVEWPKGFPVEVFFGFVHAMQGAQK
jgi:hypothetical protein